MDVSEGIVDLVQAWQRGSKEAEDELFRLVYAELRAIAERLMRNESEGHTLQPTALVHEAYLRLGASQLAIRDREHLLALSARVMRRTLVDWARSRGRAKRGGGSVRVTLDDDQAVAAAAPLDLIALETALSQLEALDARKADFVQLRHFAGLSSDQIGRLREVSASTVKRELRFAQAWIREHVAEGSADA